MKRIYLWFFLLSVLSLVACNDNTNENFNPSSLKESFLLNINITSDSDLHTKADNEGEDAGRSEEGSYLENYIDIENNDFHVVIFNSSGDFVTEFKSEEIDNKKENNEEATHFLGIEIKDEKLTRFPANFSSEEFTVVILANWRSFTGKDYESFEGKNIKDGVTGNIFTDSSFYDFDYSASGGETWYPSLGGNSMSLIPMVGIGKFVGFSYSQITKIPTAGVSVFMLRALAKITFSLKDNLWKSGFEIGSCRLNKIASKGKMIPDMTQRENILGEDGVININVPWDTRDVEKPGSLSFIKIGEEGSNQILTCYVPEMYTAHYSTSSGDRPFLTAGLTLNKQSFKEDKNFELNDNQGSSTNLFHILRNHHYNYIIEDISEEGKIELSYTVCPWVKGSVEIEFH